MIKMLKGYSYKFVGSLIFIIFMSCAALLFLSFQYARDMQHQANTAKQEADRLTLSIQLTHLSLQLSSLDQQRSQYIFSLTQKNITEQYEQILASIESADDKNSQDYIHSVQIILSKLSTFRSDMKRRNALLFQQKNLQIILNNHLQQYQQNSQFLSIWSLLKESLQATNLIALGELNRRFTQQFEALPQASVPRKKLMLTAIGANGSFSIAENIIHLNTQLRRYLYNIKKESGRLTQQLQYSTQTLNSSPASKGSASLNLYLAISLLMFLILAAIIFLFIKYRFFTHVSDASIRQISRLHSYQSKYAGHHSDNWFDPKGEVRSKYFPFISDTLYQLLLRTGDIVVIVDNNNIPMINSNAFYAIEEALQSSWSKKSNNSQCFKYQLSDQNYIISCAINATDTDLILPVSYIHSVGDHCKVLFLKAPNNASGINLQNERLDSLGKISGEVAHDINNMISVIISSLKILRESKSLTSSEDSKVLDRALFSADKSINMIDRLLTFACCQKLDAELVDINDLLEGLYEVVCFTTSDSIAVNMQLSEQKPFIYLDPGQLEASIINLCMNSINAINNGGTITISTKVIHSAQGEQLEIAVKDTGKGIAKNIQHRIFEPFFTSRKKGEGQGLGLSMVYGFVKQSGGQIKVDSVVDQGCTLSLLFPMDNHQ